MKKMLKKSLAVLLALVCVMNVAVFTASAAVVANGKLGENLKWSVDSKGVLTIKGEGEMADFGVADARPWDDHRNKIIKIVVEEGVTSVSGEAFSHLGALEDVDFPESLVFVGSDLFYGSRYDEKVEKDKYGVRYEDGILLNVTAELKDTYVIKQGTRVIADYAFSVTEQNKLKKVKMPEGLVTIGEYAFAGCRAIETVVIPASVKNLCAYVFQECESLKTVVIKNGISVIDNFAFLHCESLEAIAIPKSVTKVGKQAFSGCESLKDVYYGDTEDQWNKIDIKESNDELTGGNIHYVNDDKKGDVNVDGKINSSDALMVLQHAVGMLELNPKQVATADATKDCIVNSSDALFILQIAVGAK